MNILPGMSRLPEVDRKVLEAAVLASNAVNIPIHCHIIEAATANEVLDFLGSINFVFCEKKGISRGSLQEMMTVDPAEFFDI